MAALDLSSAAAGAQVDRVDISTVDAPAGVRQAVGRWLPLVLAVLCFAVMCALVLSQAEKMIEPDPYAYRASIAALENGDVTLTRDQYDQLAEQLQQTSLGGGISQWHQNSDGTWVSEKNPGYPFLVVGFDELGATRLAPLFYGGLACVGLWLGARRWLGRWGGTFAVGAYCSAAMVLVMAWRSFMPTFTDASLVACGLGLLVWSALALGRSRRARVIVGALAFFSFSLAVFVRYTNVGVLAVAALFAVLLCLRTRWELGWSTLLWWTLAALPPLIASLAYNAVVFDGPFSTGYSSNAVKFTLGSITQNFKIMPSQLWRAMPVFIVGLAAVIGIVGVQVWHLVRHGARTGSIATSDTTEAFAASDEPAELAAPDTHEISRVVADRWIGLFLLGAWAAVWGIYAAYQWTTIGGGGGPFGGIGLFGDSSFLHPNYSIARFYLPALGAIALLAAWLIVRLPRLLGVLAIVGLFVAGGTGFLATVSGPWANNLGGAPGAGGQGFPGGGFPGGGFPGSAPGAGGQVPDLSNCPNLPQLGPRGGGQGFPDGQSGQAGPPTGGEQPNGGPPAGLTFDQNGCPVIPTTTTPTSN